VGTVARISDISVKINMALPRVPGKKRRVHSGVCNDLGSPSTKGLFIIQAVCKISWSDTLAALFLNLIEIKSLSSSDVELLSPHHMEKCPDGPFSSIAILMPVSEGYLSQDILVYKAMHNKVEVLVSCAETTFTKLSRHNLRRSELEVSSVSQHQY
jgi:hypothetical protein